MVRGAVDKVYYYFTNFKIWLSSTVLLYLGALLILLNSALELIPQMIPLGKPLHWGWRWGKHSRGHNHFPRAICKWLVGPEAFSIIHPDR